MTDGRRREMCDGVWVRVVMGDGRSGGVAVRQSASTDDLMEAHSSHVR
jgi:hypothetical protein